MNNKQRHAIDANHKIVQPNISMGWRSRNIGYSISSGFKRAIYKLTPQKHVPFAKTHRLLKFKTAEIAAMITHDSGADGNYVSERDRAAVGLPVIRESTKRVGTANGRVSQAKHVTKLPFDHSPTKPEPLIPSRTSLIH
jgi:hypothetical protein